MAGTVRGRNSHATARVADRLLNGITEGARKLARANDVPIRDLKGQGTGKDGRVIKRDVRRVMNGS